VQGSGPLEAQILGHVQQMAEFQHEGAHAQGILTVVKDKILLFQCVSSD
jgi:hypothetical protein